MVKSHNSTVVMVALGVDAVEVDAVEADSCGGGGGGATTVPGISPARIDSESVRARHADNASFFIFVFSCLSSSAGAGY